MVAPHRGGRWTTLSLTSLTQSSSLWLPLCLQHSTPYSTLLPQILPCSTLLPLCAERWGGTWILPSSKPPCSPLLLADLGRKGFTLCPCCPRRCSERGRDGAKSVHQARAPPSVPPAPSAGRAHGRGGGGTDAVAGCTASGGAHSHRPPGDMRPQPLRLLARGWDCD